MTKFEHDILKTVAAWQLTNRTDCILPPFGEGIILLKQGGYRTDLWFLQEHVSSFHNAVAQSKPALDGYNITAHNQNPYGKYEWDFPFSEPRCWAISL